MPARQPTDGEITRVCQVAETDHGLAVLATTRNDGSDQCSVISAGVMNHPVTGDAVVALVAMGGSRKLAHLRRRPLAAVVFRAGWQWVGVEGATSVAGPDDLLEGFDPAGLRQLSRDVFTAAGGTHDDRPTYDRVMAEVRRAAVFVQMDRVYPGE